MVIAASFLKANKFFCQHEAERAAMDKTPPTDETHKEDPYEKLYKECFLTIKIALVANGFVNPIWTPNPPSLEINFIYLQSTTHFNSNRFSFTDIKSNIYKLRR
jgi:hypothetical protein